ncbi:uncharacterized protein LOC105200824 [Solenopsis invicta]|uniref:uncharacterized protein LOC105200824 n=1 Tax=Solenopsis invicta TaxID=13686 RepID=UPI000595DD83|nr:uncharacterized protein LOC105200824 [Solenopsis invicta]XP_025985963.1 uncharacterized protein LOC105200824 [Solenopsis invicta]
MAVNNLNPTFDSYETETLTCPKIVKITKFQMGWGLTRTHCQCNDSYGASTQVQKCAPSKQVLPACPPIITAAVKSTCRARRMLVSVIILIFLLAAIYWISLRQQANPGIRRPMRIQPQASRNTASEQTEAMEMSER